MATISVNNNPLEDEINTNATIRDVMDFVLDDIAGNSDVITNITLDGNIVNVDDESDIMPNTIGQYSTVDFTLQSTTELAFDALDSCSNYIDVVTGKITQLIQLYSQNKQDEANAQFAEIIEIMDLFVQLMTRINSTLRPTNGALSKSKIIQELEIHLLSVLKALIPAKEKNDIIMLCDLLEYELVDNLTQWKIKAIPELKKLKDS